MITDLQIGGCRVPIIWINREIYLELATLLLGHSDFVGEYLAGRDGALVGGKVSLITVPFSNLAFRQ